MKKIVLAISLALTLSGCAGLGTLPVGSSPAPLAQTSIDDRALDTAWRSFDVALDAINLLTDSNVIVPGTPTARSIATAIRKVNRALAAAERFAASGSSSEYSTALAEALAGLTEIRTALGASK